MTNPNSVIKITQNKSKHVVLIFFALLFVFGSYYLLIGDFSENNFAQRVEFLILPVGICGMVFFGATTIYVIYRLFKYKYMLVIESNGFVDYSTMIALGFVAWEDVESINIYSIAKQKIVGVNVKNIEELLVDKSWYVRKLTGTIKYFV